VSDDVVNVALPPDSVPAPNVAAPFLKVTSSPLGGTPKLEVTVAVNVTLWPIVIGFAEDVTTVVVAAFSTICVSNWEMLPVKLKSPL
jgi:hypothetical protein